ncbi:hypothetical protein EDC04DRAFT_2611681 [Pisolithus marmoratus]|nr:hypothetical protein EDC04DRAFT_2611681 [Pisolithus marmoratus]
MDGPSQGLESCFALGNGKGLPEVPSPTFHPKEHVAINVLNNKKLAMMTGIWVKQDEYPHYMGYSFDSDTLCEWLNKHKLKSIVECRNFAAKEEYEANKGNLGLRELNEGAISNPLVKWVPISGQASVEEGLQLPIESLKGPVIFVNGLNIRKRNTFGDIHSFEERSQFFVHIDGNMFLQMKGWAGMRGQAAGAVEQPPSSSDSEQTPTETQSDDSGSEQREADF